MRYSFGRCVLDTARRELRRDGVLAPLEPKAYQVVLYLIEHCDRVVARDELLAHAWPNVYVVDTTVARCLTLIRKAVGDSGTAQRVIKTLHGHGYRFVAPVVAASSEALSIPASPASTGRVVPAQAEEAQEAASEMPDSLPAPATPSLGERRHVSVLSATLTPAFALIAGVEVETQQTLLNQLDAAVRRAAAPYDGCILQLASDRLSIVFGVPRAEEDHAERAVLAALALRRQWLDLGTAWEAALGLPITLGIAVHSGVVVVPPANEAAATASLAGDVLPLAEHLARHASGTILISASVAPLVGPVARIGARFLVPVAGRSEPVVAFGVDGPVAPSPPGTAMGLRHHGPFIGRQGDLATLRTHLDAVRAGHGQSVGIVGPPGLGKTRLAAEFLRLDGGACTVLYGRCQSHGQHTPYLALIDLLQRWWAIAETDTVAAVAAKAKDALQAAQMPADGAGAHLLRLLSAALGTSPANSSSPQELRAQTFAALHALFIHHSQRQPLIILIEDAHWIDATSEQYFSALASRVTARRLLLLVTFRPGYLPPWQTQSIYAQIALAPLVDEDSRALVRATRRGALLQGPLETRIVARSQGNPLFLEALTRAVAEQAEPAPPLGVPDTIHSVLEARIDRLPAAAKHVLRVAAVVGPDVPLRLLRGLAAQPDSVVDDALQLLQATELLYEARVAPEPVYAFQHSLVHDVAYQSLLRQTRHELHRRAVVLLEAQMAVDVAAQSQLVDSVEPLARHALLGELWEPAVRYLQQAGMRAFARGSNAEAVVALDQAIAASEHLPQERSTIERAIDLRLALRSALLNCGEFARTLACVREAERLAESLGDHQRLAQAKFFLCLHLYLRGEHGAAVRAGQQAQALTAARDPILHALAAYLLGIPLQAQGRYAQAVECFEQTLTALHGPLQRQFLNLAILPSVTSCAFLASCASELGRFARAHDCAAEGLQIAEAVGHPPSVMFAAWGVGWAALRQGDTARALTFLERALGICREAALVLHFPMVAVPLGSTYLLAGRTDAAVALLTQTLERVVAADMVNFLGVCRCALAEALLDAGRIDEAADFATQALAVVRRQGERGYEAYTLRALGRIARRRGDAGAALDRAGESLALAGECGMAPLQAHGYADIAVAYAEMGQARQARAALAQAIERYRALAMHWHEQQAEVVLAESG